MIAWALLNLDLNGWMGIFGRTLAMTGMLGILIGSSLFWNNALFAVLNPVGFFFFFLLSLQNSRPQVKRLQTNPGIERKTLFSGDFSLGHSVKNLPEV